MKSVFLWYLVHESNRIILAMNNHTEIAIICLIYAGSMHRSMHRPMNADGQPEGAEEEHPPSPDSQPEQDCRQQTDQADQTGGRGTDPETGGIESCLGLRRAPDRSVFSLPSPIQFSPAVKKIGERGTKGRWVP